MATFVLVHGAYHGGWCWQRIAGRLAASGHAVFTPDLPGHGAEGGGLAAQTMENYVDAVAARIDKTDGPVILVGHSMAGAIVANACEARPDRIARAVFLAAYIPADGQSVSDLAKFDRQTEVRLKPTKIDGVTCLELQDGNLGEAFYQNAAPEDLAWAASRVQAQSPEPFRSKARLTTADFGRVPKTAILTREDKAITVGVQRQMAEAAGCDPIIELAADHSPFVTAPDRLTELLLQEAARNSR